MATSPTSSKMSGGMTFCKVSESKKTLTAVASGKASGITSVSIIPGPPF